MINHRLPILSSEDTLKNIDRCDSAGPIMPDYTSIFSVTDKENPKLWGQRDYMFATALNDETALRIISFLRSPSLLIRIHAARALSFVFTSGAHTLSIDVFQHFLESFHHLSDQLVDEVQPEEHLFRQVFYTLRPGHWICPICLCDSLQFEQVCYCCGANRIDRLNNSASGTTYTHERLLWGYTRYMYECLLVCSSNPSMAQTITVADIRAMVRFMTQADAIGVIICCKLLCNILIHTKDKKEEEILEFLKEEVLYRSIQSILQTLPSSHFSMFTLFHITNLIILLCDYDDEIRSVFTTNNGIEILLSIYHFSLPPGQHANLIGFVGEEIRALWGGQGRSALSRCNIHQLMSLLLWAVDNERAENVKGSVGDNAITYLLRYAYGDEKQMRISKEQEILLKFGVPRLLVLANVIISYGKFREFSAKYERLYFTQCVLQIVLSLSESLNRCKVWNYGLYYV